MSSKRNADRPPLRPTAILFGFAVNLISATLALIVLGTLGIDRVSSAIGLVAAVLAGLLTATYARQRGAIHAFLGGVLSVPVLGRLLLEGNWSYAILLGAFCTVGGIVGELVLRRRS